MSLRRSVSAVIAILLCAAPLAAPLAAQQPGTGRIQGTVEETIVTRSVAASMVTLVRVDADASATFGTRPDGFGEYHIDSLPAGRYLVQVGSPVLDSLDLALPAKEVRITAGGTTRADFTLPSGSELRDLVCPGVKLADGKVAVAGRAYDADTGLPLAGADMAVAWTEIAFDKKSLKSTQERRGATARTGALGEYRLCGVPAGRWLSLQLQHASRASAAVRLAVSAEEGAVVRDVSLSPRTAPTIALLDSLERFATLGPDSTREELQLTGTASLTGTVRGAAGELLSNVRVRVRDALASALTDREGRFTIAGLPSGTQVLVVRHLGYALTEMLVELRPGRSLYRDVQLSRIVSLDSIRVVARRTQLMDFEHNKANFGGKFLTADEIAGKRPRDIAQLLDQIGGFAAIGSGGEATLVSRVAQSANPLCRGTPVNVVVDGLEGNALNAIHPNQIGGMEVYVDAARVPAKYVAKAECGLIVIWTKVAFAGRGRPAPPKMGPGSGIGYNGY
jgi:hypothetical protein